MSMPMNFFGDSSRNFSDREAQKYENRVFVKDQPQTVSIAKNIIKDIDEFRSIPKKINETNLLTKRQKVRFLQQHDEIAAKAADLREYCQQIVQSYEEKKGCIDIFFPQKKESKYGYVTYQYCDSVLSLMIRFREIVMERGQLIVAMKEMMNANKENPDFSQNSKWYDDLIPLTTRRSYEKPEDRDLEMS